jgi:membrane dipeptidase
MRALSDVPRNVTDEMLWALAKNGGVIGISFGEGFVNPKDAEALESAIKTETTAPTLTGRALDDYAAEDVRNLFGTRVKVAATVVDVADHIDHAVRIAGIDHVGIGSDFDGVSGPPNGLDDVSKMPALIEVLLERGYAERDVKKILGENYLRVIREVTGT